MDVRLPDGTIVRGVPDGMSKADLAAKLQANGYDVSKLGMQAPRSFDEQFKRELYSSLPVALARGGKDILDTGAEWLAAGYDKLTGADRPTLSSLVTGEKQGEYARVKAANDAGKREFEEATENSYVAPVARIGGQIIATAPVGGILAAPLKAASKAAPALAPVADAVATAGFRAGGAKGARGMATRAAGGAATAGASVALVDPEQAGTGAAIGAVTPAVLRGMGAVGEALTRPLRGPAVPESLRAATLAAREAGYVVPPTQARPTFMNRAMEGMAGKISTAQNASARNQPVTNDLVKRAIGADELSPQGLQAVRERANSAYNELAGVGAFQADEAYVTALQKAAGSKALPGIVNKDVDELVGALSQQTTLDAQQTIESIKRLRFDGSANKSAPDPAKRALGSAQMKIAAALEDLIDRNLQASGQGELLAAYRSARQTLAKTYDVEKALEPVSGNIDARKLAALLKKGRPLSGELKQVAEFGARFPKAAQLTEQMGSLPQVSPLDFGALGTISAVTSNPYLMAGLLARPAARAGALSGPVQNRLAREPSGLLGQVDLGLLPYRAAPLIGADQ